MGISALLGRQALAKCFKGLSSEGLTALIAAANSYYGRGAKQRVAKHERVAAGVFVEIAAKIACRLAGAPIHRKIAAALEAPKKEPLALFTREVPLQIVVRCDHRRYQFGGLPTAQTKRLRADRLADGVDAGGCSAILLGKWRLTISTDAKRSDYATNELITFSHFCNVALVIRLCRHANNPPVKQRDM